MSVGRSLAGDARGRFAVIGVVIVLLTVSAGVSYSGWTDQVLFMGRAKMACWEACIRVRKSLDGVFTDPETGAPLTVPNRTHIAVAAAFPSRFLLTICVENCGSTPVTDVVVTDVIENTVEPGDWSASSGVVDWVHEDPGNNPFYKSWLTWSVGVLGPGEVECLEIWIDTLPNNSGKHEPTSGDDGDGQDVEINSGAVLVAHSEFGLLEAETLGITLWVEDDGVLENGVGLMYILVGEDLLPLPYSTPWAEDRASSL